ncbi:hypothetical protein ACS0TY_032851 [Phlomoides rotata]
MHNVLFVRPGHVPSDITNPRWKWYKDQMDVSSQQSNCFGNGIVVSKKGSGGTHRVWSQCEERVLLAALKDLVAKGKKLIMASVLVT